MSNLHGALQMEITDYAVVGVGETKGAIPKIVGRAPLNQNSGTPGHSNSISRDGLPATSTHVEAMGAYCAPIDSNAFSQVSNGLVVKLSSWLLGFRCIPTDNGVELSR